MYAFSPLIKLINGLVSGLNFIMGALNKVGNKKIENEFSTNSDLPKSSGARLNSAGMNNANTITNIDKALLEIKGINLPGDLAFESSGNSKNITFDLGQNK